MKKSLVIISFAFIFLLSVSFVSANFFDWITGDAGAQTSGSGDIQLAISPTLTVKEGATKTIGTYDVQLTKVEDGVVQATITDQTGKTQDVTLEQGTNTLTDGTKLTVSEVKESWLFGDKATISVLSPSDGALADAGVGEEFAGETGFAGASICESLIEEEVILVPGDVGDKGAFLNGRFVELDEDGFLTIDGTYSYPLEKGDYFVPIPVQACYWEASYDGSKLDIFTVCPPVAEEFVEEEPVV